MLDFLDTKKILPGVKPAKPPMATQWPWERHLYAKFLREVHGMQWGQMVAAMRIPMETMKRWAREEGWLTRGAGAGELEEFSRKQFLKMAEGNGMPKAKAVKLLIEGMTKPTVDVTREKISEDGSVVEEAIQKPDYDTRHKYQKDYWVLAGLYATGGVKGTEFNVGSGGTVNVQVIIPAKAQSNAE
jgi:hypothetical protein